MLEQIYFQSHGTLERPLPQSKLVSATIGPNLELVGVWKNNFTPRVIVGVDGQFFEVNDPPSGRLFAQPLSSSHVLVVGDEAIWSRGRADKNALIVSADGRITSRGCVGDGINGVYLSPAMKLWISYGDTGIYGNNGWGRWCAPTYWV